MAAPFDPDRFEELGRYGPMNNNLAYGRTKLLDQLFTNELARRLEGTGVTANSVCPGFVATNLVDMGPLRPIMQAATRTPFVNTPAEGARLVVRLADRPQAGGRHWPLLHDHARHETASPRSCDARHSTPAPHLGADRRPGRVDTRGLTCPRSLSAGTREGAWLTAASGPSLARPRCNCKRFEPALGLAASAERYAPRYSDGSGFGRSSGGAVTGGACRATRPPIATTLRRGGTAFALRCAVEGRAW